MTRRTFGKCCTAALAVAGSGPGSPVIQALQARTWTSQESFDDTMNSFLKDRSIPGGALAVVKDGRLVHAQGYGWADRSQMDPVQPQSLFRIASLSKPITAVAILKLVQQEKLSLQARPYESLNLSHHLPKGATLDPRWKTITVQQLLQHTGGWDRATSFDPMFRSRKICRALSQPDPAQPWNIISYMLGQPLDFDPGTRYAYSNFGYCLLGRLIESVSGQSYEDYTRQSILLPLGITRMRLGKSREVLPDEVRYYMPDKQTASSVFDENQQVAWPYGGFHLEAMDAHGGWLASAVDLARFSAGLTTNASGPLLNKKSMAFMHQPPPPPVAREKSGQVKQVYYGSGWSVRPKGEQGMVNAWHTGSLPGTYTLLVRRWDGISYAALFNQRSHEGKLDAQIDPMLYRAASQVTSWPDTNLFDSLS